MNISKRLMSVLAASVMATSVQIAYGAPDVRVVNVGVALPLTGRVASSGQTMLKGYQMAVEDFNANEGARDSVKVQLIVEDDRFNPATGQTAIKKLITSDGVKAILGTYGSEPALAESAVAERYKIPNVQPEASAGKMVTRGYRYLFNTFRLIDETESKFVDFLNKDVHPRTAAIIYINNDFARDGKTAFLSLAKKSGIDVVSEQEVQSGSANFTSALSKIKEAKPDVLQMIAYVPDAIVFLRGLRNMNISPKVVFIQSGVALDPSVKKALGPQQLGVMGMPDWYPESPFKSANEVAAKYQQKYKADPREEVIKSYQAAQILLAAVARSKSGTSEEIAQELRKTNMDVVGGHVTFASNGQASIGAMIAQVQSQGIKAVYPDALKQANWEPFK